MIFLLELPTGVVRCQSAEQAKRYAELFIIVSTGAPPLVPAPPSELPSG